MNLALVSLRQFRERLLHAKDRAQQILAETLPNDLDQKTQEAITTASHSTLGSLYLGKLKWWWKLTLILAWVSAVVGLCALYRGIGCGWSFLLLIPPTIYSLSALYVEFRLRGIASESHPFVVKTLKEIEKQAKAFSVELEKSEEDKMVVANNPVREPAKQVRRKRS
jgi:hypothetical protein